MTLINDLTTLVQALLQVTPLTVEANAEAAEKTRTWKQKAEKWEKGKGGGGAGGANSTNSNKLDSENVNAARIKFSQRCIALNT